jgi:hypothetical protein
MSINLQQTETGGTQSLTPAQAADALNEKVERLAQAHGDYADAYKSGYFRSTVYGLIRKLTPEQLASFIADYGLEASK